MSKPPFARQTIFTVRNRSRRASERARELIDHADDREYYGYFHDCDQYVFRYNYEKAKGHLWSSSNRWKTASMIFEKPVDDFLERFRELNSESSLTLDELHDRMFRMGLILPNRCMLIHAFIMNPCATTWLNCCWARALNYTMSSQSLVMTRVTAFTELQRCERSLEL